MSLATAAPRQGWELQLHPPGAGRVRYFQISPRRRQVLLALGAAALLVLIFGLVMFPGLIADWTAVHPEGATGLERAQEMRRLQALLHRVDEVHPRSKKVRFDLRTLHHAYGLPEGPFPPLPQVPTAPPANVEEAVARSLALLAEAEAELTRAESLGDAVAEFQRREPAWVLATPSIRPLAADSDDFVLISGFGERQDAYTERRQFHAGLDLAAPPGTPIVATASGVVAFAGSFPAGGGHSWWRYGLMVVVAHGDRLITVYGHCQELSVRSGERVRRGQQLGTVGNSGWSQVPHLHYEVRRRAAGRLLPEDPRLFMLEPAWGDPDEILASTPPFRAEEIEPLPGGLER